MADINFKLNGPDLASRTAAAKDRAYLLANVAADHVVAVDLSEVISLSHSYADELFGVLAAEQGWEWFIKNIKLRNPNEHTLRVVAEVIKLRLQETGQPIAKSA